ncbi:hypothetical protein I5M32_11260 [Pedobacter sp. SD-b]|uniref:Uncharacterized protein n=1 Tax=Pedobacter segetis TaxID=2793069 RepID=A0ABS1BKW5_9SPHI|nr:hypothetical protein [Pedobacter segetis]MBK0383535.1 hypothetical protein [Pedobacter segetis]
MYKYKNAADLEKEANELSNYDGGYMGYDGSDDDMVEFAGPVASFRDQARGAQPMVITIINTGATALTALLCPGLNDNAVGKVVDGAFNDVNGFAGLTGASGTPTSSLAKFYNYIRKRPSMINGFKISTSNVAQMEQQIQIQSENPFKIGSSRSIAVGTFANEQNFNTQILSIPESFYMDDESIISYTVLPGTTVTLTLMLGVSVNPAKALRKKTAKAKSALTAGGAKFIG